MGYRSNFFLDITRKDKKPIDLKEAKEIVEKLEILTNENFNDISSDGKGFQIVAEDIKWYDYEDDLKKFTSENSDLVICCKAEGEDHDDTRRILVREGESFNRNPVQFIPPFKDEKTKTLLLIPKERDHIRMVTVPEYDIEQSIADYERFGYETMIIKSADIFGKVTEF